jgi:hypothetical protein
MSINNPSITYLITSIGRPFLDVMLRSIHGQFNWDVDKIKIYIDGPVTQDLSIFYETMDLYNNHVSGSCEMWNCNEHLGYWGHGIRNKYQSSCTTDYIFNCDDDDIVAENTMNQVRRDLKDNYGKLLVYKFRTIGGGIIWTDPVIRFGNVGTPSGLIPNRSEIFGEWGLFYGGDYQFYQQTADKIGRENVVFKDIVIYKVRPDVYGF